MDMATGRISKWHVREGEQVAKGAPLFEIETDKAAMEVESPGNGVIGNIAASEGIDIPVGTAVAFIYGEGEAVTACTAPAVARPLAAPPARRETPAPQPVAATVVDRSGPPRATPLARRLARERGIDLPSVPGTGPRGRIQAEDVKSFEVEERSSSGMRRILAESLVHAKQTVPHFYLTLDCDLTQILDMRAKINERAPLGPDRQPLWKLSINDLAIKALALALQRVPTANVTWTERGILQHRASDIGVAVAVEDGLYTPVIRSAEAKSLSQISNEMKDMAAKARARRLAPADCRGGATTVSNLGMYGIEQFAAIINPPQATILAVGAAIERAAAVGGRIVARMEMNCTLSCDHRAVDGALGAELLAAFKLFIEEPALMLA
jgi:pyruvate dehydrogenase E2 component (dihydrolipoamide acetyltransferase)